MSFTNQTQHYGLPQYIGTDVPAYLTDYNGAMATIDAGMNAAKTQADTAATAAGQATNDVQALASTVNTQAAQISAAASAASAAQTSANNADAKAQQALDAIGAGAPSILSVNTSGWLSDGATGRYKKELQLVEVANEFPNVAICGSTWAAVPTDAEIAAYAQLVSVKADTDNNKIILYAKEAPASAFYIQITGVTA